MRRQQVVAARGNQLKRPSPEFDGRRVFQRCQDLPPPALRFTRNFRPSAKTRIRVRQKGARYGQGPLSAS